MCWLEEKEASVPSRSLGRSTWSVAEAKRLWTGLGWVRVSVQVLAKSVRVWGLFCSVLCAYLNLNNSVENPILKQ